MQLRINAPCTLWLTAPSPSCTIWHDMGWGGVGWCRNNSCFVFTLYLNICILVFVDEIGPSMWMLLFMWEDRCGPGALTVPLLSRLETAFVCFHLYFLFYSLCICIHLLSVFVFIEAGWSPYKKIFWSRSGILTFCSRVIGITSDSQKPLICINTKKQSV